MFGDLHDFYARQFKYYLPCLSASLSDLLQPVSPCNPWPEVGSHYVEGCCYGSAMSSPWHRTDIVILSSA
jgi:hypothetical protein